MNTTHTNEPIEKKEKLKAGRLLDELDLRDYFAAKAMQAIYAAQVEWQSTGCPADAESLQVMEDVAGDAYAMADAMLRAREQ